MGLGGWGVGQREGHHRGCHHGARGEEGRCGEGGQEGVFWQKWSTLKQTGNLH